MRADQRFCHFEQSWRRATRGPYRSSLALVVHYHRGATPLVELDRRGDCSVMPDADENAPMSEAEQALEDDAIRDSFGGIKNGPFRSLLAHHHMLNPPLDGGTKPPAIEKPKAKQVNVPVFMTLMVKHLQDDPDDENQATVFGTMIQRALFLPSIVQGRDDPEFLRRKFFEVRVNEGLATSEEEMFLRKAMFTALKRDGKPTQAASTKPR